jgi:GNAT superfamily N-acetyltransferase
MATPGSPSNRAGRFFLRARDNQTMEVLPFTPLHAAACLALFDANTPDAFHPGERADFVAFLAAPTYPYFVLVHDDAVVACGGFRQIEGAPAARLHWGMVRPDLQRQGLGRYLLLYRLREIGKLPGVEIVECGTTPLSAPFFEKQGFHPISLQKDGWGPGMDRIEMRKKLAVCP